MVSLLVEHAQVGTGEGLRVEIVQCAHGHADDIGMPVKLLGDTAALVHAVAVRDDLRAAYAKLYREAAPAHAVDLVDGHHGESAAVFGACATPLVRSMVLRRAEPVLESS